MLAILLVLGCARPAVLRHEGSFSPGQLVGTWHVTRSTFPMWLDGKKTGPTLTYELLPGRLRDTVAYRQGGQRRTIEGIDRQDADNPWAFRWRGRGALALFTSRWEVARWAPDGSWAVIVFSRTLVTPAGMDVITREDTLTDHAWAQITSSILADPVLLERSRGLAPTAR